MCKFKVSHIAKKVHCFDSSPYGLPLKTGWQMETTHRANDQTHTLSSAERRHTDDHKQYLENATRLIVA